MTLWQRFLRYKLTRKTIGEEIRDQGMHAVYGALVGSPTIYYTGQWEVAATSALLAGIARELEQWWNTRKLHLRDRVVDAIFFPMGVLAVYGIARLVALLS